MPFDEPACVVDLPKDEQRLTELLDAVEGPHPEQVLLERANEALGTAIPLGSPHEGGRACDAQKSKLLLEGVGHVLAPVIVPHGQTAPAPLSQSAEVARHALPARGPPGIRGEAAPRALADGLDRVEAGRWARDMDADALRGAVVDGDKPRE